MCTGNQSDIYVQNNPETVGSNFTLYTLYRRRRKNMLQTNKNVQTGKGEITHYPPLHKLQILVDNNLHARNLLQYRLYFTIT
jgi:hypothetical protein